MNCPNCGYANRPTAKFCQECGTRLRVSGYLALQLGQLLNDGTYRVSRPLSRGGMGALYLAEDLKAFGRLCVIKEMLDYFDPLDPAEVRKARQRFEDEARTLAALRHTGIPQIYTYFSKGQRNYIVMEYAEGTDLEQGLTHEDDDGNYVAGIPHSIDDVLEWGIRLCRVLEYLASHDPAVVHHDIKPANIIVDVVSGEPRLVDFGTARARLMPQLSGSVGLQKSSIYGTAGYAPPEQYQGKSTAASDIYALAVTLYHLLTDDDPRQHPFDFPKLKELPAGIRHILESALSQDAAARPDATTLRQQLEALRAPRRSPLLTAVYVALIVVPLLGLGVLGALILPQARDSLMALLVGTPTLTATSTPRPNPVSTFTPSSGPPPLATSTPLPTYTGMPLPTHTGTPGLTPTPVVVVVVVTPTPTHTPSPTFTPTPRPTTPPTATPTETLTPTPPSLSGRLAFPVDDGLAHYDIWATWLPDGKPYHMLVGARQPDFSSDGRLLVNSEFSLLGQENIGLVDANSNWVGLVSDSPTDSHPFWDPNGTRYVFGNPQLVRGSGGTYNKFLFVPCSLKRPQDEEDPHCRDTTAEGVLVPAGNIGEILGEYPVWTADGTHRIAFRGVGGRSRGGIYLVGSWATIRDGGGQNPALLVRAPNARPTDAYGDKLLFFTDDWEGNWEAYAINLDGGNLVNLSNSPHSSDGLPAVSPDGHWVAFVSDRGGHWAIWVVPIMGGRPTKLMDFPRANPWGVGDRDWTTERITWGP